MSTEDACEVAWEAVHEALSAGWGVGPMLRWGWRR
jgi:hypothetical protein